MLEPRRRRTSSGSISASLRAELLGVFERAERRRGGPFASALELSQALVHAGASRGWWAGMRARDASARVSALALRFGVDSDSLLSLEDFISVGLSVAAVISTHSRGTMGRVAGGIVSAEPWMFDHKASTKDRCESQSDDSATESEQDEPNQGVASDQEGKLEEEIALEVSEVARARAGVGSVGEADGFEPHQGMEASSAVGGQRRRGEVRDVMPILVARKSRPDVAGAAVVTKSSASEQGGWRMYGGEQGTAKSKRVALAGSAGAALANRKYGRESKPS